ncbi:uracil-DNA glycosylase family protein [Sulfurovum sp. TSL1]|uniref:uracil-DNA glycosylase family protein n=1 Tax=Sulfurovum sp. TSL1 TaxID=2826994 RepID=UPI001CC53194|nr:uracil-DNA glycosylase family protein [Sulfurovum sp. TSL1]GIT98689.1 uracil-DNA glycosylase [Sulfurovum sp. TSL1]
MSRSSWERVLSEAYASLEAEYQRFLEEDKDYFPSKENYFNAFNTLSKEKVKYILFGQDPYPRKESAGGYAFIDTKVQNLFSDSGLSKEVNRATSLRNFIKMALVASHKLTADDTSQEAIAKLDKTDMIDSIDELRRNFEKNGVLLLNTALIFTDKQSTKKHVKAWKPFVQTLLNALEDDAPKLILFGTHAKDLKKQFSLDKFATIELEHPYNHTFISNPKAVKLFGPMHLLDK